ncbi:DUF4236 domain-containing protein [Xenorhabdus miraniensis]|uniref:DUF4236 domain-containing protein n=1 Tax=Xenorhabdus miraniensis TaxID=351674 RepID=A0A2D0JUP0_9GAMM|nr:DUF4236 domain-containing protein [Xenorhabdus miraniensis]PHM50036.1 hypothetical protein Xmir_00924 [Xenorhabdus miraniensis]
MGFKFRKRIKIAPGIYINTSKSGVSTSIGGIPLRQTGQLSKQFSSALVMPQIQLAI